jgi:hypothetical protein
MPFRVITGTFHVLGYSPDGDSVRFQPTNPGNLALLSGPPADLNGRGHTQLRFEAIDTLETHFLNEHQPLTLATRALDFNLLQLGITGVEFDVLRTRVTAANDATPGYIVSRAVEKNRRPVAFVFAGPAPVADGSTFFLDTGKVKSSVNYKLVTEGLAYPTYYKGLFPDLRGTFTAAVRQARAEALEIWAVDKTNAGFAVPNLDAITEDHVILPKLFRRLAEFLDGGGVVSGFKQFLENRAEGVTIISTAHFTHFDTVVRVTGNVVQLTELPENLMFEG